MGPAGPASCRRFSRGFHYPSCDEMTLASPDARPGRGRSADSSTAAVNGICHMLSFGALAAKVFGSANDRKIKAYRPTVDEINALEPELEQLSDADLRARTEMFRKQLAEGTELEGAAGARLRHRARGRQAHARPAPFRRAADRRHGAAPGQDRRDEDRRGQDAGRHASRLPQRPGTARRARRHGQRLPRQARRRVDGPHLQVPRAHRRLHRARARRRPAARSSTPATSPTAPTTSWASTTCATT